MSTTYDPNIPVFYRDVAYSPNTFIFTGDIYPRQINLWRMDTLILLAHIFLLSYYKRNACKSHMSLLKRIEIETKSLPFSDDIFKCILLNESIWIAIKSSLKFVPNDPINNIPGLVQITAWRRRGDKPLSEPMVVSFRNIYALLGLNELTSNGSWCMGIKGEMSGTVCVTFTWYMYIYELFIALFVLLFVHYCNDTVCGTI